MKRVIGGTVLGAALGFALAFLINEFIFAGPEYGDALLWAVVGAVTGHVWSWRGAEG